MPQDQAIWDSSLFPIKKPITQETKKKGQTEFAPDQERPPNHPRTVFSNELEGDSSSAYLASVLQISGEERSDGAAAAAGSSSLSSSLYLYLSPTLSGKLCGTTVLPRSNLCNRREPRSLTSQCDVDNFTLFLFVLFIYFFSSLFLGTLVLLVSSSQLCNYFIFHFILVN